MQEVKGKESMIEFHLSVSLREGKNQKVQRSIGILRDRNGVNFPYYGIRHIFLGRCKQLRVKRCYSI